ncbi:MAG: hypothetical protein IKA64_00540 [Clostridia bacterium]|nr:hypothetical protein [Clostridia bacterium]
MKCLMQQLRGTSDEWQQNDRVIPAGTIALLDDGDGRFSVKIGDGERAFSALPFLGSRVKSTSEVNILLERADDVRYGVMTEINVSFPDPIEEDYYATLCFDTNDEGTMLSVPEEVRCAGSSCYSGYFYPDFNCHYTLVFWYDGAIQCTVRGVYHE